MSLLKHIINRLGIVLILVSFFAISFDGYAQDPRADEAYKAGESIFKANCTSCHKVHDKLVGPALAGVYDKYDREWLYSWIKNSQALIKSGDAQAIAIYEEYNKSVMTAFSLKNEEIDKLLTYIQVETTTPAAVVADGDGAAASGETPNTVTIFLAIIMALLVGIMLVLGKVTGTLNNIVKEKLGQLVPESISIGERLFNKKTLALLSIVALILVGYKTVDSAQRLGRQQGYKPTQPIKFSHKLHAGVNEIPCQYCHSGADKGKSAVIPSANVCMNCHKGIKEGPKYGTQEIAKIYDAVGWDAEEQKYIEGYEQKPIEWVRIHNLPDHVYFSHAQHVNAGKQECQTCHGPVEEMEVLEQHQSLGMGWCVNCHRQTKVNFTGNDYYQVYDQYHDKLKKGEMNQVTVEDIGGLECQKCHY